MEVILLEDVKNVGKKVKLSKSMMALQEMYC